MAKSETYTKIHKQLEDFLSSYDPPIQPVAVMTTICSLIKTNFPSFVFVGFYLSRKVAGRDVLEIGPYQGTILACARIEYQNGVCGAAATAKTTQVVNDVCTFDNYIACDQETKSEIVVPLVRDNQVVAVLDIDSDQKDYFTEEDQVYLEKLLEFL